MVIRRIHLGLHGLDNAQEEVCCWEICQHPKTGAIQGPGGLQLGSGIVERRHGTTGSVGCLRGFGLGLEVAEPSSHEALGCNIGKLAKNAKMGLHLLRCISFQEVEQELTLSRALRGTCCGPGCRSSPEGPESPDR
jgi:hypothetical protein